MSSAKFRRQAPLTEAAAQEIIAAAHLTPADEPRFREWLNEADQGYLNQLIELGLTPKQIGLRLDKIRRLSDRLNKELQHPLIRHYLEIDRVRAEPGHITWERVLDLANALLNDIDAIERIHNRSLVAYRNVAAPNPHDSRYFGKRPAEQPDIRELIRSAHVAWVHVLGRSPRRTASFVTFVQVVLAQIAKRSLSIDTVRSRLKSCHVIK